jgi:hypothetical protein
LRKIKKIAKILGGEYGYNGRYIFTWDCRMTWDFRGLGKAYEEERLLVIE